MNLQEWINRRDSLLQDKGFQAWLKENKIYHIENRYALDQVVAWNLYKSDLQNTSNQ